MEYLDLKTGALTRLTAKREVIVSAGAVNTPKLLQLSGVGPHELLDAMNIPIVHDLPGVGANLKDHYSVRIVGRVRNSTTLNEELEAYDYWYARLPTGYAVAPASSR